MTPDTVTVSIVFVEAAMSRLPGGAAQRARVLAQAGVPAALMDSPQARVSAHQFAGVWLAVVEELGDEFFGLDAHGMRPGSFALICRSLLSSRSLGQGLRRCLRGFGLFLVSPRGRLSVEGEQACLHIEAAVPATPAERFAQEIFATVLHGVMCWLAGQQVPLTSAAFNYPRPPHWDEYHAMFSRTLRFDAPGTLLRFDARWLDRPVHLDEAGAKRFLASAPLSIFVKYRNPHSWAAQVRRQLRDREPAAWPRLHDLSAELGVAASTLARRLTEEGTSYQGIKDHLRRDRAIELLSTTSRSVADIAAALGFDEASAFYRAFRRWTGALPASYRNPAG